MKQLVEIETEKVYHFVITCEICGQRVDESTHKAALHVAEQTGRILEDDDGRVWFCDHCKDAPEIGLYGEPTHPKKKVTPTMAELGVIADYLDRVENGGTLSPETLENLRALGYVFGEPPAATVAGKSLVKTFELKQAGITK